jgi:serine phosphatase RsbU (regulator of sigma subunit)
MRVFLLTIFLACSGCSLCAQTASEIIAQSDAIYSSDPDSSLSLCKKALVLAEQLHDTINLALAKAKCARYYILKSDFENATAALNSAIGLQQAAGDKNGLAYSYKLKAIMMKRIGNVSDALSLQQQSVQLYREAGNPKGMCSALINLVLDYIAGKQFDLAENALDTVAAHPEGNQGSDRYFYWQNRGKLQFARQDYSAALVYYDSARNVATQFEMTDSYVTLLSIIAEADIQLGRYDEAQVTLTESCNLARKNNLDHELNESLMILTELYVSRGDYKNAFLTNKEQTDLAQKIYNIDRVNKINELEKRLELSEKEKTIAQQEISIAEETSRKESLERENYLLFIVIAAVALIAGLTTFLFVRTRMLNRRIEQQKLLIEEKSALVENAYSKIRDSISYSRKIQRAMLPTDENISALLPHSFVLYEPRDIVSGDFYWFQERGDEILFAAADCTGHGVPGAFLSIVGYNHIHQAVNIHQIVSPEKILDKVREDVSQTLKQYDDNAANDGMDVSVCSFNRTTKQLKFAGANHAVWILRNNSIHEIKGDAQPIGAYPGQEIIPYSLKEFQLEKNDRVYLLTDGYCDQFGGEAGKKFKSKQLKELLIANAGQSIVQQKQILLNALRKWQCDFEQIDDVLVIGVEV